jgi:hypothetical protein
MCWRAGEAHQPEARAGPRWLPGAGGRGMTRQFRPVRRSPRAVRGEISEPTVSVRQASMAAEQEECRVALCRSSRQESLRRVLAES